MSDDLRPFRVEVPDAVLEDLRDRLARTRWPDQIPGSGWDYGTDLVYLHELCEYWRTTFDWRAQEERFNQWPHFLTEIDGEQVHFIHARSPEPDAFPIVITHGWPGSVSEFLDIIDPLCNPRAHGGDPKDAFHVVCPSHPGLRMVGADHAVRLGRAAGRRSVEGVDGAPRLRPLRRAGRRLGCDHLGHARDRSTRNTSPGCTATCCSRSRPTRVSSR